MTTPYLEKPVRPLGPFLLNDLKEHNIEERSRCDSLQQCDGRRLQRVLGRVGLGQRDADPGADGGDERKRGDVENDKAGVHIFGAKMY